MSSTERRVDEHVTVTTTPAGVHRVTCTLCGTARDFRFLPAAMTFAGQPDHF